MSDHKTLKQRADEIINKTVFEPRFFAIKGDSGFIKFLLVTLYAPIKYYHLRLSIIVGCLLQKLSVQQLANEPINKEDSAMYGLALLGMTKNSPNFKPFFIYLQELGEKLEISLEDLLLAHNGYNLHMKPPVQIERLSLLMVNSDASKFDLVDHLASLMVSQSVTTWLLKSILVPSIKEIQQELPLDTIDMELLTSKTEPAIPLEELLSMQVFKDATTQQQFLQKVQEYATISAEWFKTSSRLRTEHH